MDWEYDWGHINSAINIPLNELEGRLDELKPNSEILVSRARTVFLRFIIWLQDMKLGSEQDINLNFHATCTCKISSFLKILF
jgi:hypothetical protein